MLSEILEQLGELKKTRNNHYKKYKDLEEQELALKSQLTEILNSTGLKSAKGDKYMASISEKADLVVSHEQSVIDWLNETPNIETDFYIGLKKTEFKQFAKGYFKETGEIIPGTETVTKQTLTIKENKK